MSIGQILSLQCIRLTYLENAPVQSRHLIRHSRLTFVYLYLTWTTYNYNKYSYELNFLLAFVLGGLITESNFATVGNQKILLLCMPTGLCLGPLGLVDFFSSPFCSYLEICSDVAHLWDIISKINVKINYL